MEERLKNRRFEVMKCYCRFYSPESVKGVWQSRCKYTIVQAPGEKTAECEVSRCPFYKKLFPKKRSGRNIS